MMVRGAVVACVLFAGCNGNKLGTTPPGTVLLDWKVAETGTWFERMTIDRNPTPVESSSSVKLGGDGPSVDLKITVTTLVAHRTLDGKEVRIAMPAAVKAIVADAHDYTLEAERCDEPMHVAGSGDDTLAVMCHFGAGQKTRNSEHRTGGDFLVCSDGHVVDLKAGRPSCAT